MALAWCPAAASAQSYRIRVDASAQAVAFRGLVRDSIDASLAVPGANGGLQTIDGFAVRCGATGQCQFLRPGAVLHGLPMTTTSSLVLWGLGVEGLAFHATARVVADVGRDQVLPGTVPAGQLLEGYFEYRRAALVARAGRQLVSSRLEPIGFDGAQLRAHIKQASLDLTGYGGWGLGQAAVLAVTSPALNPLDEWRPRDRQWVAGSEASWVYKYADIRGEYRREVDPVEHAFVSERAALSATARIARVRVVAGADYNLAEGRPGSADLELTYTRPRYALSGGVRRYQPYFSLWTLWGAFSPVPYTAANASAQWQPASWLHVHARGERYQYANADISTALTPTLEDRGWRANTGATATVNTHWTLDGTYSLEHGPGASGRFADGTITYTPTSAYAFDVYGGTMARPLELRYYDATSRWIGARASWQVSTQQRLWSDVALVNDDRARPDAGASSMSQLRVRAGLSLAFGSKADRIPLPPAHPRGP